MQVPFEKEITDIVRFEHYIKDYSSLVSLVSYSALTHKGNITVPDDTIEDDRTNILNKIADYSSVVSTEEQSIAYVDSIIDDADDFGKILKKEFINENIRLGISVMNKTKYVRVTMREVNECIDNISLKDAITECEILLVDLNSETGTLIKECPFVNIARVTDFMNKLKVYCGLPL